mmetsp:Transcript_39496/g.64281  ORF Transcript_39496/g.64281 Transcript_39496/m.64281 type:complete len:300 (+) Transcript_39496:112-1011(+)
MDGHAEPPPTPADKSAVASLDEKHASFKEEGTATSTTTDAAAAATTVTAAPPMRRTVSFPGEGDSAPPDCGKSGALLWSSFIERLAENNCTLDDLDIDTDWKELLRADLHFSALQAGRLLKMIKLKFRRTLQTPTVSWVRRGSSSHLLPETTPLLTRPSSVQTPLSLSRHPSVSTIKNALIDHKQQEELIGKSLSSITYPDPPAAWDFAFTLLFVLSASISEGYLMIPSENSFDIRVWALEIIARILFISGLIGNSAVCWRVWGIVRGAGGGAKMVIPWLLQALVFGKSVEERAIKASC